MRLPRYRLGARFYDVLSLEGLLYRRGRRLALDLAQPQPGDRVLDVGCGTGLSFEGVIDRIGPASSVVGVDSSKQMLRRAADRVRRRGWSNVTLDYDDAAHLPAGPFDVVLFCYSLSIVDDWRSVWAQAVNRLAPNARIVVVDTAYPSGPARLLTPLVWVMLAAGGVRPNRRVWRLVDEDLAGTQYRSLLAGHIRIAVGRRPHDP